MMITGMNIQAGARVAPAYILTLDGADITQNFSDRLTGPTIADSRLTSSISRSMILTG